MCIRDSIGGFSWIIEVEAPGFFDRMAALLTVLLLLLLTLLGAYYLRYRPDLPRDLRLAMGPRDQLQPVALGDPAFWRRVLGVRPIYPVHSLQGDQSLGTLVPIDGDLYLFRSISGLVVKSLDGQSVAQDDSGYLLAAGRLYQRSGMGVSQWLRVEYG